MMINIAVVEDEAVQAEQIKEYLERYGIERDEKVTIDFYTDGDEFVDNYSTQYDIILLDIVMEFMDGMAAAAKIREVDQEVVIIFITNMAQYAIKGYSVNALDYILKPVSYFAFSQRLDRAIQRMKKRSNDHIIVSAKHRVHKLEISDIYFIESHGHRIVFHTKSGAIDTTLLTMKSIEERLLKYKFYRGNKGYLINLEHVEGFKDGYALVHGERLIISRSRKKGFLQAVANYVGEVLK